MKGLIQPDIPKLFHGMDQGRRSAYVLIFHPLIVVPFAEIRQRTIGSSVIEQSRTVRREVFKITHPQVLLLQSVSINIDVRNTCERVSGEWLRAIAEDGIDKSEAIESRCGRNSCRESFKVSIEAFLVELVHGVDEAPRDPVKLK